MKRKLIKQMCHEWRDNVWLILSLMIVFTVVWGGMILIYLKSYGLTIPRGYDCTDVYSLNVRIVEKSSNYYDESGADTRKEDFSVLLGRLRELPSVESVMYHWGALPYNYNYMGRALDVVGDTLPAYYGNTREASPEIVDVLRLKSLTGATSFQLKEMLAKGEILISDNSNFKELGHDPIELKGKKVFFSGDSTHSFRVGDVIENIRRNDYEPAWAGTIVLPMDKKDTWGQVAVRVKPGMGKKFEEDFKEKRDVRILRNVFLTELESMANVREANQRSTETDLRQIVVLVIFVLITIFLGLLGTFWFRVQQRIGEIAIRKICGATRRAILGRILSEGLTLLAVAVVIMSTLMWIFILSNIEDGVLLHRYLKETIWLEVGAIAAVALGIVISLLYPAMKAMRIEPAVAVKSE